MQLREKSITIGFFFWLVYNELFASNNIDLKSSNNKKKYDYCYISVE